MNNDILNLPAPDTLVAAALYLMTSHAKGGCPMVGRMVLRQLNYLAQHPSAEVTPMLREVCLKLACEWERLGLRKPIILPQPHQGVSPQELH